MICNKCKPISDILIHATGSPMCKVCDRVRNIAKVKNSELPILILGEIGTGKGLVAKALHIHSRREGTFAAFNSASFADGTMATELFGSKKGVFTGALDRPGAFKSVGHGTIFFDEIDGLPLKLQRGLLRVIPENVYRVIGEDSERKSQAHTIFASNKDLKKAVADGDFLPDLLSRINVLRITIPPLRARGQSDLLLLADHFSHETSNKQKSLSQKSRKTILSCPHWRDNVRALKNVINRAYCLSMEQPEIEIEYLDCDECDMTHPNESTPVIVEMGSPTTQEASTEGSQLPRILPPKVTENYFMGNPVPAEIIFIDDKPENLDSFLDAMDLTMDLLNTKFPSLNSLDETRVQPGIRWGIKAFSPRDIPKEPDKISDFFSSCAILMLDLDFSDAQPCSWSSGYHLGDIVFRYCPWLRNRTLIHSRHGSSEDYDNIGLLKKVYAETLDASMKALFFSYAKEVAIGLSGGLPRYLSEDKIAIGVWEKVWEEITKTAHGFVSTAFGVLADDSLSKAVVEVSTTAQSINLRIATGLFELIKPELQRPIGDKIEWKQIKPIIHQKLTFFQFPSIDPEQAIKVAKTILSLIHNHYMAFQKKVGGFEKGNRDRKAEPLAKKIIEAQNLRKGDT